jgi:hypothetical protein
MSSASSPSPSSRYSHAEEGEVVLGQPLQKVDRFRHLRRRSPGRIGVPIRHGLPDPCQHGSPAGDGATHIGQGVVDLAVQQFPLDDVGQRFDLDMEKALEPAARQWRVENTIGRRIELKHGMGEEPHHSASRTDCGQHAVDDERHVGREHFDDLGIPRASGRHDVDIVAGELAFSEAPVRRAESCLQRVRLARRKVCWVGCVYGGAKESREPGLGRLVSIGPRDQDGARIITRRFVHRHSPIASRHIVATLRPAARLVEC